MSNEQHDATPTNERRRFLRGSMMMGAGAVAAGALHPQTVLAQATAPA